MLTVPRQCDCLLLCVSPSWAHCSRACWPACASGPTCSTPFCPLRTRRSTCHAPSPQRPRALWAAFASSCSYFWYCLHSIYSLGDLFMPRFLAAVCLLIFVVICAFFLCVCFVFFYLIAFRLFCFRLKTIFLAFKSILYAALCSACSASSSACHTPPPTVSF